jgi:CRISPR-associated endonuclease/helicase Cas3
MGVNQIFYYSPTDELSKNIEMAINIPTPEVPAYLAHVVKDASGDWRFHSVDAHLRDVGILASEKASVFDEQSPHWAQLAGLWHDMGKYSQKFQNRIKYHSSYDTDANMEGQGKPNHSSAGALHARKFFQEYFKDKRGDNCAKILGYLIAGHHSGLPDWGCNLSQRLELKDIENQELLQAAIRENLPKDILKPSIMGQLQLPSLLSPKTSPMACSFWARMLFSCLVDADFLDTEAFMDHSKAALRGNWPELATLKPVLDSYMTGFERQEQTPLNRLRKDILESCLLKANVPTGIYTLTVPTGGGKTLSGVNFALNHALHHGKKRIIYVLPFTSILEQTADVFRKAFAALRQDFLIEHYSRHGLKAGNKCQSYGDGKLGCADHSDDQCAIF